MGDGHPDIDDLPVTVGTLKTQGDIYAAGADTPFARIIDAQGQASNIGAAGDTTFSEINPTTGATDSLSNSQVSGRPLTDYLISGLYNSSFTYGPPDPNAPLGPDNPLPYWTVGGTSTTGAYLRWNNSYSTAYVSNPVIEAVFPNGFGITDDIYIEQIVPAPLMPGGGQFGVPIAFFQYGATYPANGAAYIKFNQGPSISDQIGNLGNSDGTGEELVPTPSQLESPSYSSFVETYGSGYYYVRIGFENVIAPDSTVGNAYITRVQLRTSADHLYVGAGLATDGTYASAGEIDVGEISLIRGLGELAFRDGTRRRLISRALVPLTFTRLNIPASATTEMQLADTDLALATPRIPSPWPFQIVGISYRLSTAITGGNLRIEATAGGVNRLDTGNLSSASPVQDYVKQVEGTAESAGTNIGCQVVTGGGFTPTSLDLAVVVWVAVDYTV